MAQVSHIMQFRLGKKDNEELGVVSPATAEAALNGYLSDGWTVKSFEAVDSTKDGVMYSILLLKG